MAPGCGLLWCLGSRSDSPAGPRQLSTSKANGVAEEHSSAYPELYGGLGVNSSTSSPLSPEGRDSSQHWNPAAGNSRLPPAASSKRGSSSNRVVPVGTNAAAARTHTSSPRDSPSLTNANRHDRPRGRLLPPDLATPDSGGTFTGDALSGEQLYASGFKLYNSSTITSQLPGSNLNPLAFLVLDMSRMSRPQHPQHQHLREGDSATGGKPAARMSGRGTTAGEPDARTYLNTLVPVFTNSCCRGYFKIASHPDYVAVIRKLLKRDPLLSFALQKAVRNLKTGDPKSVSHVTPDPSGQTSSLYGLRLTPCCWRQDGRVLPALMVEHNLPYDPNVVMPRLMRDYAVLSHVPAILTLIDFEGKVLYQNASSLEYMGDLLSAKYNAQLSDGLLQVLYTFDLHSLEQMLEHVLGGLEWQGVVQVPYNLRRYLGHHQDQDTVIDFLRVLAPVHNGTSTSYYQDDLSDDEFQIGGGPRMQRKGQPQSILTKHAPGMQRRSTETSDTGATPSGMGLDPTLPIHRDLMHASASPRLGSGNERTRLGSASGAPGERRLSFLGVGDLAPGMQQRKFMSLLDKQAGSSPTNVINGQRPGGVNTARSSPSQGDEDDMQNGMMEDEDMDDDDQECYHEVHAIPLLDPVLDKQVIMLVQTDVTPRVELENKLADLTDAQLSMLEQLFPRHIIEYMLARVPSKASNNMRDLANTHEKVMVLFCDVVGFTSMSKEVEAAQVMHFLNELYETFDDLVDDYGMYKLDIVGDCYIVVAGLIKEDQDGFVCVDELEDDQVAANAVRIMGFAKKMLQMSQEVLMPHNNQPVSLRIGIHTGPLVSGLVGSKMPKFTLFGDTMNTASRMESTCRPGCIHVSDAFGQLLPVESWESTGGVQVKGKGLMETFLWVPDPNKPQLNVGDLEADGTKETMRSLRKLTTMASFTSQKSRHTVRSNSTRRRESQTSGGDQGRGGDLSNNPLMTILSNIGGGFRDDDGGDLSTSSGPLGSSMRPKSGRLRLGGAGRRAPSTAAGLELSGEFERRTATEGGMSGPMRPRVSAQAGLSNRGLANKIGAIAAGSRRASYLEPLAQYPEAHLGSKPA